MSLGDFFEDVVDIGVDIFTGDTGELVGDVVDIFTSGDVSAGTGLTTTAAAAAGGGNGSWIGSQRGEFILVGKGGAAPSGGIVPFITQNAVPYVSGVVARWGKGLNSIIAGRGVQIRARDMMEIVKKHGPGVAAGVVGWTVAELMQVLAGVGAFTPKKRRRRGISARDVRTTRRVCGFVQSISRQLADCRPRSYGRGRGKAGGAQFVRQG